MHSLYKRASATVVAGISIELARAEEEAERNGRPARRYADFRWSTLDSWSRRRRVVAKGGMDAAPGETGANPRFIVTSLKAKDIDARTLYERVYLLV